MTATRTTVETKRVTLYVCEQCGKPDLGGDLGLCRVEHGGHWVAREFAPLPSEKARAFFLEVIDNLGEFYGMSEEQKAFAAELSQAWSGK